MVILETPEPPEINSEKPFDQYTLISLEPEMMALAPPVALAQVLALDVITALGASLKITDKLLEP